jgi:hypothetical protein
MIGVLVARVDDGAWGGVEALHERDVHSGGLPRAVAGSVIECTRAAGRGSARRVTVWHRAALRHAVAQGQALCAVVAVRLAGGAPQLMVHRHGACGNGSGL